MALATVAALRDMLQIGDLYPDADLLECCNAADNIINRLLTQNVYGVIAWEVTSDEVKIHFQEAPGFIVGQDITVSGVHSALNGTRTITAVGTYWVQFHHNHADQALIKLLPHGSAGVVTDYSTNPNCVLAANMTAADIWQARVATNGQPIGIDYQPSPYRMGVSMSSRIKGLIAPYMSVKGMVG